MSKIRSRILQELEQGEEARRKGNEGRARVCARRAASLAAKEFLARQGIKFEDFSGYGILGFLGKSGLVDDRIQQIAAHMTMSLAKDAPDEESYWPLEADLLEEARWMVESLLGEGK